MLAIFFLSTLTSIFYVYLIIKDKSILIKSYFLISLIAFPLQGLFLSIFKFSHPLYNSTNNNIVILVLIYTSIFGVILYLSFKLFSILIINFNIKSNFYLKKMDLLYDNKFIVIFSVISFSAIICSEIFFLFNDSFFSNSNFLRCSNFDAIKKMNQIFLNNKIIVQLIHQPIKIVSETKYMFFIILGEVYRNYNSKLTVKIIYWFFFLFFVVLGFVKGSKVMICLFIIIFIFSNRKNITLNLKNIFKLFSLGILSIFLVKITAFFRNLFYSSGREGICHKMNSQEIVSGLELRARLDENFFIIDLFVTRLNYLIPFTKAYEYITLYGPLNAKIYFNNFIGFIPRIFWRDKPILTNDMHIYAYKFGVTKNSFASSIVDYSNLFSVSFRPEGESFIYLGWYGLFIAISVGFIFSLVEKLSNKKNILIFSLYIYLVYIVTTSDVYFVLLPSIVQSVLTLTFLYIILILSYFINKKL